MENTERTAITIDGVEYYTDSFSDIANNALSDIVAINEELARIEKTHKIAMLAKQTMLNILGKEVPNMEQVVLEDTTDTETAEETE